MADHDLGLAVAASRAPTALPSRRGRKGLIALGQLKSEGDLGLLGDQGQEQGRDAVGALAFVDDLPDGIDTDVQERGARLSAGQRQLICFARALVPDPRLVVLDEATSSIDIATERRIEDALDRLLEGRTAVIIAHRLSTIRRADVIVVVEDGRIAETGSHDDLIRAGGRYAALYADWEQAAGTG